MPYITKDTVSEIRSQIRQEFPKYKFSVVGKNHTSLYVILLKADFDVDDPTEQLNDVYIEEHPNKEIVRIFSRINEIIEEINPQRNVSHDGDYGNIPNFYINFRIGSFDRPYERLD